MPIVHARSVDRRWFEVAGSISPKQNDRRNLPPMSPELQLASVSPPRNTAALLERQLPETQGELIPFFPTSPAHGHMLPGQGNCKTVFTPCVVVTPCVVATQVCEPADMQYRYEPVDNRTTTDVILANLSANASYAPPEYTGVSRIPPVSYEKNGRVPLATTRVEHRRHEWTMFSPREEENDEYIVIRSPDRVRADPEPDIGERSTSVHVVSAPHVTPERGRASQVDEVVAVREITPSKSPPLAPSNPSSPPRSSSPLRGNSATMRLEKDNDSRRAKMLQPELPPIMVTTPEAPVLQFGRSSTSLYADDASSAVRETARLLQAVNDVTTEKPQLIETLERTFTSLSSGESPSRKVKHSSGGPKLVGAGSSSAITDTSPRSKKRPAPLAVEINSTRYSALGSPPPPHPSPPAVPLATPLPPKPPATPEAPGATPTTLHTPKPNYSLLRKPKQTTLVVPHLYTKTGWTGLNLPPGTKGHDKFLQRLAPYLKRRDNPFIDVKGREADVERMCVSSDGIEQNLFDAAISVINYARTIPDISVLKAKAGLLRGLGLDIDIEDPPVFSDEETAAILSSLWQLDYPESTASNFKDTLHSILNLLLPYLREEHADTASPPLIASQRFEPGVKYVCFPVLPDGSLGPVKGRNSYTTCIPPPQHQSHIPPNCRMTCVPNSMARPSTSNPNMHPSSGNPCIPVGYDPAAGYKEVSFATHQESRKHARRSSSSKYG
ncbi:hypothetical protein DIPPA_09762 [Diplonema papillatum]|nr:hypothetical protein DIPPA_09762 [Diplonema papillatum]